MRKIVCVQHILRSLQIKKKIKSDNQIEKLKKHSHANLNMQQTNSRVHE